MMSVTNDMVHWLGMNEPDDQQDKDDLIQSIETRSSVGHNNTQEKQGQVFVSGWSNDELRLPNQKAVARFVHYIRQSKVPDDIDRDF
jgi:hypothetical protein